MTTGTYPIIGMHCASCAATIEKRLSKVDGVASVQVNFGTEAAKIAYDESKTDLKRLSSVISPLGYTIALPQPAAGASTPDSEHAAHVGSHQSKQEKLAEIAAMRRTVFALIPLAVLASAYLIDIVFFGLPPALSWITEYAMPLLATVSFVVGGRPYLLGLFRFLRHGTANMDTLIGLGTLAAYLYSLAVTFFGSALGSYVDTTATYFDVTVIVITFITIGKYLEAQAKVKTGDAIEKLLNLQAKTALVVRDGKEVEIPVSEVVHGDRIIVKPSARIPVDGTVADGSSYVDESMVTGEPMPVKKEAGDTVVAGTMNTSGTFTFMATKVGSETMLAHIITMVEEAQGSRAPIQALVDRISAVFVPTVLVLAFVALGAWLYFGTGPLGFPQALAYGLTSFIGILVIACPCALGLATPTAIIVGVGKGAREGILIKDAATLEKLHKVSVVVVDKTGTLTRGKPDIVSTENRSNLSDDEVISVLASLEDRSEHPIAHAIVSYAKGKDIALLNVSDFEQIKGMGVTGIIGGVTYHAGSAKLAASLGAPLESLDNDTKQGRTPVVLVTGAKVIAIVMVADAIKPESIQAVKDLHALGIRVVMLTGDDANTARAIAKEAGIDDVVAEVMPADKLAKIKALQQEGAIVAMAGDGVNDAPALAQADVGIAMATGTDVAIESAGITLLHGDIGKLVKAVHLSKFTMRGIKQNLFWAFVYNVVGIPLAGGALYPLFGWLLSPVFAGFAMAASSVSVVGNSLRIKAKAL